MTLPEMREFFERAMEYPPIGYQLHKDIGDLIEKFGTPKKVAEMLERFEEAETPDYRRHRRGTENKRRLFGVGWICLLPHILFS